MSYMDMTFCKYQDCKNFGPCRRSLTDEVLDKARNWWGGDDAPIAVFLGKPVCYEEAK